MCPDRHAHLITESAAGGTRGEGIEQGRDLKEPQPEVPPPWPTAGPEGPGAAGRRVAE
jgi:hypothetical protein